MRQSSRRGGRKIKQPDPWERLPDQNVREEFQDCYKSYYSAVFKHAAYLTGNLQAAEDIVQEAFIKLYHSPPGHPNIKAWLVKVATNLAYNYSRDRKIRSRKDREEFDEDSQVISIEDMAIRNTEIRLTRRILNKLNERDRLCLLLKFSGYKYNEIAEIAGVEKNSVGQILARAQAKFAELYVKEV